MADLLKQRLIGALLVLSIIIIVAFFLVKNATNNAADDVSITKKTEFTSSVESLPVEVAEVDQETLVDPHGLAQKELSPVVAAESNPNEIAIPAEKAVSTLEAEIIKATADTKLAEKSEKITDIVKPEKPVETELVKQAEKVVSNKEQWLIQLASFSQKPNAIALQSKVKQLGLTANIEHVGTVYRVRIGPESSRAAAEELVAKLADELKLEPQILTVKPDSNK